MHSPSQPSCDHQPHQVVAKQEASARRHDGSEEHIAGEPALVFGCAARAGRGHKAAAHAACHQAARMRAPRSDEPPTSGGRQRKPWCLLPAAVQLRALEVYPGCVQQPRAGSPRTCETEAEQGPLAGSLGMIDTPRHAEGLSTPCQRARPSLQARPEPFSPAPAVGRRQFPSPSCPGLLSPFIQFGCSTASQMQWCAQDHATTLQVSLRTGARPRHARQLRLRPSVSLSSGSSPCKLSQYSSRPQQVWNPKPITYGRSPPAGKCIE